MIWRGNKLLRFLDRGLTLGGAGLGEEDVRGCADDNDGEEREDLEVRAAVWRGRGGVVGRGESRRGGGIGAVVDRHGCVDS